MLRELHIRNFALLEDARFGLREGFNCLTGETGVGKSLVLGALDLLLGGRARPDLIRKGAEALHVEGLVEMESPKLRSDVEQSLGFPLEEDVIEVLLERRYAAGRNRCRVNGRPVSVATLRAAGERLVDIHGQRQHESLLRPANQRAVLDGYGKLDDLRGRFAAVYEDVRKDRARLAELEAGERLRRERMELLEFQRSEVEALGPQPGEHEHLQRERDLLANSERLQQVLAYGIETLYEMDGSAAETIQRVARGLQPMGDSHADLARAVDALNAAATQVDEATHALRSFREGFEFDPERLEEVQERLAQYQRVAQRHDVAPNQVHALGERLAEDVQAADQTGRDLAALRDRIAAAEGSLIPLGRDLCERRRHTGAALARQVGKQMRDLAMPGARFAVEVRWPDGDPLAAAGPSGMDAVEFMIATNPGEDLMPLRQIGSGGEVARVMLAVKSCLAEVDRTPVFVFDEIDANVGGRLGDVIGSKLAAIARKHQVVCITHLPQIAAHADVQVKVDKTVHKGRTVSRLTPLSGEARVEEIAAMIHGDRRTKTTLRQAREMLDAAEEARAPSARRRAAEARP